MSKDTEGRHDQGESFEATTLRFAKDAAQDAFLLDHAWLVSDVCLIAFATRIKAHVEGPLLARIAELEICNSNQQSMLNGKHEYVGQDFSFRIEKLRTENARLQEQLAAVASALPGPYYLDPPDGGSVTIAEQVKRMAKDLIVLKAERDSWINTLDQVISDTAKELGCDKDNEAILEAIAALKAESTEPVAWMYPSDLKRFQEKETFATAFSVSVGNPTETTVPLYPGPAPIPADMKAKYEELLYSVSTKWPSESRHETALRYIRQQENSYQPVAASQEKKS